MVNWGFIFADKLGTGRLWASQVDTSKAVAMVRLRLFSAWVRIVFCNTHLSRPTEVISWPMLRTIPISSGPYVEAAAPLGVS